jgi:Potential Monad-binding region of RPAP3
VRLEIRLSVSVCAGVVKIEKWVPDFRVTYVTGLGGGVTYSVFLTHPPCCSPPCPRSLPCPPFPSLLQAYSHLGGNSLSLALSDLDLLLSFEPSNAIARSERTRIAVLTRENEKKKPSTPEVLKSTPTVGPTVKAESTVSSGPGKGGVGGGGGDMMAERTTRRISAAERQSGPGAGGESSAAVPPIVQAATPPFPLSSASTTTTAAVAVAGPSKDSAVPTSVITPSKTSKREPALPSEPPKTLYELERAWRGLKDRPDLFSQYLTQNIRKKSVVKKVFKEAVSPELLSSVFISLRDFCTSSVVLTVLGGLSSVNHFSMLLALLPVQDLDCIKCILERALEESSEEADSPVRTAISELKLLYKM